MMDELEHINISVRKLTTRIAQSAEQWTQTQLSGSLSAQTLCLLDSNQVFLQFFLTIFFKQFFLTIGTFHNYCFSIYQRELDVINVELITNKKRKGLPSERAKLKEFIN